ncbi:unannotated protein [freshwater metagenome]|uniref:Unannotated protein n=1 Tax=freshwater metagenome TaxID=449393 RepID=A0A6J7E4E3_9ZZZZ
MALVVDNGFSVFAFFYRKVNGKDSAGSVSVIIGELRLLDKSFTCCEYEIFRCRIVSDVEYLRNRFAWQEREQVCNVLTFRVTRRLGDLITFGAIHAAFVSEEQQPMVCCCDQEVLYNVVGAQFCTLDAFTATVLGTIVVAARSLNVTITSNGDNDFFLGNKVLVAQIAFAWDNRGAPIITIFLDNLS